MPSSGGQTPPNFGSHIFDQKHSERVVEESRLTGFVDVVPLGSPQLRDRAGRFGQGTRRSTPHPGDPRGGADPMLGVERSRRGPPRTAAGRGGCLLRSAQHAAGSEHSGQLGTRRRKLRRPTARRTAAKPARTGWITYRCICGQRLESSPRLKPGDSWLKPPGPQAVARVLRSQHQQGRNRPWRPCWPQRSCPGA